VESFIFPHTGMERAHPDESRARTNYESSAESQRKSIVADDKAIGSFKFNYLGGGGRILVAMRREYSNGRLAVEIVDERGEPYGTLSANIVDQPDPGEIAGNQHAFYVKNWSENEPLAEAAWRSGLFEDTGLTRPSRFVEAPIWTIKPLPENMTARLAHQSVTIRERRQEEECRAQSIRAKAEQVWAAMTENEKTGVRFGLYPAEVIAKAEAEMGWPPKKPGFVDPFHEEKHMLALALLYVAKENGGIRA
jgi:hypothetical protein